ECFFRYKLIRIVAKHFVPNRCGFPWQLGFESHISPEGGSRRRSRIDVHSCEGGACVNVSRKSGLSGSRSKTVRRGKRTPPELVHPCRAHDDHYARPQFPRLRKWVNLQPSYGRRQKRRLPSLETRECLARFWPQPSGRHETPLDSAGAVRMGAVREPYRMRRDHLRYSESVAADHRTPRLGLPELPA